MQAQEKGPVHVRRARVVLWLPAIATAVGYAVLLLLVLTSGATARGRAAKPAATVRTVETQGVVQASAVAAATARCPASAPHAVGPEFSPLTASDDGQVTVSGSFPNGRNGWTVVVKNLSGQAREYVAGVVCIGAPRARFAFVRTSGVAQAQRDDLEAVTCPRSAPRPLGSTFQLQPGGAPGSAVVDQAFAALNKRGRMNGDQVGGMRNLTDTPVGILVGATCTSLPVDVRGGGTATAPQGKTDGYNNSCYKRGELAVGAVFFPTGPSDNGSIVFNSFFRQSPRVWEASVNNLANHPVPYFMGAVCIG